MPSTSFFLERDEFIRLRSNDGFLEWREYNGHLYGTPRSFIDGSLRAGLDVIVKPEVNGALAIKERYAGAVLSFLLPTNFPTCAAGEPTSRSPRV